MELYHIIIVMVFLCNTTAEVASCEDGWTAYKDELCIKTFSNVQNFEDAQLLCLAQSTEMSTASLVMIKESGMQEFLVNYTQNVFDNVWLGSKYDSESDQFTWIDGQPLTYANWLEGYPRNPTSSDACIELRPVNAQLGTNLEAKWADVNCQKRNLVICQRALSWTLQDAVEEIIRIRKQHQDDVDKLEERLQAVSSRVVPIGSIYIEYFNQPSPTTLWPELRWQDITNTYAGLFFRASGGGSGSWGEKQTGCAPRITTMQQGWRTSGGKYPNPLTIPEDGWSIYGDNGDDFHGGSTHVYEGLRFHTAGCEVRPTNQAIRIWKRTA